MRKLAFFLSICILFLSIAPPNTTALARTYLSGDDFLDIVGTNSIRPDIPKFRAYIENFPDIRPSSVIKVGAEHIVWYEEDGIEAEPILLPGYMGFDGVAVHTEEDALIEFEFTVQEAGFYNIRLLYWPVAGKSGAIRRGFFINGELPFRELAVIEFSRTWQVDAPDFVWARDNQGNDLRPQMREAPEWMSEFVFDANGFIYEPLSVFLSEGTHTLSIISINEPMVIGGIFFENARRPLPYAEQREIWENGTTERAEGVQVRVEAENAARTSSQMLFPLQDQSTVNIYPNSPRYLRNNSIGGQSWRLHGQWLEWDFYIPESGFYAIGMRVNQNFMRGLVSTRRITINGEVPFSEFSAWDFDYNSRWRGDILSDEDGNPYEIFLEAGWHTMRMQYTLGGYAAILDQVQEIVHDLNAIYRRVIRITGVSPDIFRDYQVTANIPGLVYDLIDVRDRLDFVIDELRYIAGGRSSRENVLLTMRDQLNILIRDQERFTRVITSFRVNIRACGNFIAMAMEQPLQLDVIYFFTPDSPPDLRNAPWYLRFWYGLQRLWFSFFIDYNLIGNITDAAYARAITLWIGTGRDQANIIKALIDNTFTPYSGIGVNVMLVDMGTLLQATLARQGPDVAIQVMADLPMNFGLRNAVADLSQFDDLHEVTARFNGSAMVPLTFEGRVFGLPETQTFPMMFYRRDILAELGLEVPSTWQDVRVAMAVLAQNQMDFGVLPGEGFFATLLFQNGGRYYNDDATRSALDEEEGITAFRIYTRFFTEYNLDVDTSVEERFRTGEAPLIISDFTTYNNFQVSAPDIKGLWGIAPVPATVRADGTLNRAVASNITASVIMQAAQDMDAAWEFLKWWTSAETQTAYGREMESLMGAAARVPTANMEAFRNLPWPRRDLNMLLAQFENAVGIPQVPGGYFTFRNVNNAFYAVVNRTDTVTPREELMDRVILINNEIRSKRMEFGLHLYEGDEGGGRFGR